MSRLPHGTGRDILKGLALLTGAAGALAGAGGILLEDPDRFHAIRAVASAWGVTACFFLPARAAFFHPGPWYTILYAAGFLARLGLLGAALAVSTNAVFPLALAASLFLLEWVGIAWSSRPVPRRASC